MEHRLTKQSFAANKKDRLAICRAAFVRVDPVLSRLEAKFSGNVDATEIESFVRRFSHNCRVSI